MNRFALLAAMAVASAALAFGQGLAIGAKLDKVTVQDLEGKPVNLALSGQTTAVIFISTKCPISNDYNERMNAVYKDYSAKGVKFVFVNANVNEPAEEVAKHAKDSQFAFTPFKDAGALADQFGATVTPETYVFDSSGTLRYHGYVDDARNAARVQVTGLRDALDAVMGGKELARKETKAFGCTIKRARKAS
jgi:cytochrome oxidase Cu insertion factor (SCO1/SenC/PrrC family)